MPHGSFFKTFQRKRGNFKIVSILSYKNIFNHKKNTFTNLLSVVKLSGTGYEPLNSEIINTRSTQLEKSLNFTKFPSFLFVKIQLLKNENMNKEMSGAPGTAP